MFSSTSKIIIVIAFIAQFQPYSQALLMKNQCLACICEALSGCTISETSCDTTNPNTPCGPFGLTHYQYLNSTYFAGYPPNENRNSSEVLETSFKEYEKCALDMRCSTKYFKNLFWSIDDHDCNQNGQTDCDDLILKYFHDKENRSCYQELDSIGKPQIDKYNHCKMLMNWGNVMGDKV